jgi:hypothetical protein
MSGKTTKTGNVLSEIEQRNCMLTMLSESTQNLIVIAGIAKCGWLAWRKFTGADLVDHYKQKANKQVVDIVNEFDNGVNFEVDDVTDVVSSNVIDSVDIKLKPKRRVKAKAPFRAYLVRIGKAKFGLLKDTPANRMCVRKYLYDACVEHGVLARHIADNVDIATKMVFVCFESELVNAAVTQCNYVKKQSWIASLLGSNPDTV